MRGRARRATGAAPGLASGAPGGPPRGGLTRGARAGLLLVALVVVASARPVAGGDVEVRTAHVRARGDLPEERLRRYAALAEACWSHWKDYFGAEPKKADLPLLLDVRRDRDGFEAALKEARVDLRHVGGAGGYYDPGSKTSYLFLQPHDSSTRLLVLHELTHQWHAKVWMRNDLAGSPYWHKEGIAEWFGHHRRTAQGLEVGVLDGVAIDDRPARCAERFRAGGDPWGHLLGQAKGTDYTDALMLVGAFLRTKDASVAAAYRRFEQALTAGGDVGKKAEREFGPRKERVLDALRETWGELRRPWKLVYIAWDEEAGAIVGEGRPWAFLSGTADLPRGRAAVAASIALDGPRAVAGGIALGVKGPDDLVVAEVRADAVVLRRKARGTLYDLGVARRRDAGSAGPVPVRLEVLGARLVVTVDGHAAIEVDAMAAGLASGDLDGAAGLCAEGGPVRFYDVQTGAQVGAVPEAPGGRTR